MPTTIEVEAPTSLANISLRPRAGGDPVFPSPVTWRDQVLYFLLPDRFSDGKEAGRPLFDRANPGEYRAKDKACWMREGTVFQGGTLKGIESKLDYLQGLGVTALWVGPIWKQHPSLQTYHGYGIQNFLDVDPRFGTRQDLRDLVDAAHGRGMYVLLDVIVNHSGNNWFYDHSGMPYEMEEYRCQPSYPFAGWRDAAGRCVPQVGNSLDTGVWPREFQNTDWYTRAGKINRWDPASWENPLHPDCEFRRGDFFDLKDLRLSENDPGAAEVLNALVNVYRYWIALSDCDGFRMDTVKHISWETARNFCGAMHEYTEAIGKENFLMLGEVTGGAQMERDYLSVFGRNLDAVLDIGEPATHLARMVKGFGAPADFFSQFGGHDAIGSHRETGRYHISILDDHDMVGRDGKHRFAAGCDPGLAAIQVANAVGVQLATLGIPCIYYGTEQAFDGAEARHDAGIEPCKDGVPSADRYIRESMSGGSFGAMETAGCHFFDTTHPAYLRIAAIARLRNRKDRVGQTLRRGRQYVRDTRFWGETYGPAQQGELVAWERVLFDQSVLVVLNTNGAVSRGAHVALDERLSPAGSTLAYLYHSYWSSDRLTRPPADQAAQVVEDQGRAAVRIELPPAGMAILTRV